MGPIHATSVRPLEYSNLGSRWTALRRLAAVGALLLVAGCAGGGVAWLVSPPTYTAVEVMEAGGAAAGPRPTDDFEQAFVHHLTEIRRSTFLHTALASA